MTWNAEEIRRAAKRIKELSLDMRMLTGKAEEIVIFGDIEYHAQEILKLLDELGEVRE